MAAIFSLPKATAFDSDGILIPGAKLYFYDSGTTDARNVYSDSDLDPSHVLTQPVVADSAGRFPVIYMQTGLYKVVLATPSGSTIYTADELDSGFPAGTGIVPVASGGTGADDAATALTNLGAASADDLSNLSDSLGDLATKDTIEFVDLEAGFGAVILQRLSIASTTSVVTCSTAVPNDNTIPQIGEGDQVLSGNFTPKSASSKLVIAVQARGAPSAASIASGALFTGASTSAIAATRMQASAKHMTQVLDLVHQMDSPGTNQITFSFRAGASTGTVYINGDGDGASYLGGIMKAEMTVTEYATI